MSKHNEEGVTRNAVNVPTHVSHLSQGSGISGVADSSLSNGDSLRLSDFPFPQPPPSPNPFRANFSPAILKPPPKSLNLPRIAPLVPVRRLPESVDATKQRPASEAGPVSPLSNTAPVESSSNLYESPHDWHEGASSLDVDSTEDRLLPTSFITSLLRQNAGPRIGLRASASSDAVTGISEITYPPINVPSSSQLPTRRFVPERRPQGARLPLPFIRKRENSGASRGSFQSLSSDTHTYIFPEASNREKIDAYSDAAAHSHLIPHIPAHCGAGNRNTTGGDGASLIYTQRQSISSTRTIASSVLSKLSSSRASIKRILARPRIKPLPPVPLIPEIPLATEREYRKDDEATPLSDLVERAGTLQGLLERGYHPHRSAPYDMMLRSGDFHYRHESPSPIGRQPSAVNRAKEWRMSSVTHRGKPFSFTKRWNLILCLLLFLAVLLVALVAGLVVGQKSRGSTCPSGMAGSDCDLNVTCICTATNSGSCHGVAKSIIDLVPSLNAQFMLNVSNADIFDTVWQTQIWAPSSCTNQALLVDVAPALHSSSSPNRTQWARTAILWNLVESQDLGATQQLREFVLNAPWKKLQTNGDDGNHDAFLTNASGFQFDFASQEVITPAQSFSTVGQPSADQDSRVNSVSRSALDYLYGHAVASSTQRHTSLANYWASTLQRQPSELQTFITAFGVAPIVLPFDANGSLLSSVLSVNPETSQFPPPLACYPGLNSSTVDRLDAVEHDIFQMPHVGPHTNFPLDCYPNHPVYGILDVLQLRLPTAGYPRQAALLQPAVAPRAVVYNGELLSSEEEASSGTPLNSAQRNPRRFGTLNHFEHVIFDYLKTMNTSVANATIDFVLNTSYVPPGQNSTLLLSSLDSVPLIEVAVFGSVTSPDIRCVESSFTTDSGALFFGSNAGSILRQWTIAGINNTLVWAQNATSPEVVREKNITDKTFNNIWDTASLAIARGVPDPIDNLTQSLTAYGYFAP